MHMLDTVNASVAHPRAPWVPRDFIDKNTDTTNKFKGIPNMFLHNSKDK
jgi:hypothetical protein